MTDASGRVVVSYNGEIYNDIELRSQLQREFGFVFRSNCDTEILPYAYRAWGSAMFDRLEGLYAIALWDREQNRLILARDGIGIKPLYFAQLEKGVLFASEVKGILASGLLTPRIDADALHTFLAAGHAGPTRSLISDVQQIPPGSFISFTHERIRKTEFWRPRRNPEVCEFDSSLHSLEKTLGEVVESQLVSDVPLGVLQSGGIDSSLISLSVARRGLKVPLFTAKFHERSYDESKLATAVAKAARLPQHFVSGDSSYDVDAAFRSMVYHFDGQCADTGALGFYKLCAAVRAHTTVVLSGDGGDEFFAGYETYAATRWAERLRHIVPRSWAALVGRIAYTANARREGRLPAPAMIARFFSGLAEGGEMPHLYWRRLVPAFIVSQVYGPAMEQLVKDTPYREYGEYYSEKHVEVIDKAMIADQRFHLQSVLAKVDAMSMAHSLEVRVPLLDRRIMNLAGKLPVKFLNPERGPSKLVLRKLAVRIGMPSNVAAARKRGFNVPNARLLRGELAPLGNELLDRNSDVLAPYLKADKVRRLWRAHRQSEADHAFALWPMLVLATWKSGLARPEETHLRTRDAVLAPV
jgi:asparagine synthase (glutamine-hydrolysing)